MTKEVFSKYDVMSVGEAGSVTPEEGLVYTGTDEHELNMIFHFQHMELDQKPGQEHWDVKPLELADLKKVLTDWQENWNIKAGIRCIGAIMTSPGSYPVSETKAHTAKHPPKCLPPCFIS